MTFSVRSVTSGSIETQFSSGTDFPSLSYHSKLILTFRLVAFQRDLAMARCTRCWKTRPKKLDCQFVGLGTFRIPGELWPQPNGPGNINHRLSRGYRRASLKRTLSKARTSRTPRSLTATQAS